MVRREGRGQNMPLPFMSFPAPLKMSHFIFVTTLNFDTLPLRKGDLKGDYAITKLAKHDVFL